MNNEESILNIIHQAEITQSPQFLYKRKNVIIEIWRVAEKAEDTVLVTPSSRYVDSIGSATFVNG